MMQPIQFKCQHQWVTSLEDKERVIPSLTRAAVACGVEALFIEVHDDPPNALSDANTVLDIKFLEVVMAQAIAMHDIRQELRESWGR